MTTNSTDSIFGQCVKPKQEIGYQQRFEITEAQSKDISDFRVLDSIYGFTIDKTRFVGSPALIIPGFAMAITDAWKVFSLLFEKLGDAWRIDRYDRTAIQVKNPAESKMIKDAIDSWSEEKEELDFLCTVNNLSFYHNEKKQLITFNPEFIRLVESYGLSVNYVDDPHAPVTMTHNASLGFAGIIMPIQLTKKSVKHSIDLLELASASLKGVQL